LLIEFLFTHFKCPFAKYNLTTKCFEFDSLITVVMCHLTRGKLWR